MASTSILVNSGDILETKNTCGNPFDAAKIKHFTLQVSKRPGSCQMRQSGKSILHFSKKMLSDISHEHGSKLAMSMILCSCNVCAMSMQYCNTLQWYAMICNVVQQWIRSEFWLQCVTVCSVSAVVRPPHHRKDPVRHGPRQCGHPKWLPQPQSPPGMWKFDKLCPIALHCFETFQDFPRLTRIQSRKRPDEPVARGVGVSASCEKVESSHPQHVTLIMYSEKSCWVVLVEVGWSS